MLHSASIIFNDFAVISAVTAALTIATVNRIQAWTKKKRLRAAVSEYQAHIQECMRRMEMRVGNNVMGVFYIHLISKYLSQEYSIIFATNRVLSLRF